MNSRVYFPVLILMMCFMVSCNVSPQPITYGSDGCHFCSMTIVDRQHAAQIVTKKGKAFKFDAIECMMNHTKDMDEQKIALFLVNDYDTPGELIDAKEATYLINKEIPSPMGEFLTGFADKESAKYLQTENDGKLFSWIELQNRFKR